MTTTQHIWLISKFLSNTFSDLYTIKYKKKTLFDTVLRASDQALTILTDMSLRNIINGLFFASG